MDEKNTQLEEESKSLEVVEEKVEKPVDDEEQKERTRLGRKVKSIEAELAGLSSSNATLISKLDELISAQTHRVEPEVDELGEPKYVTKSEAAKEAEATFKKLQENAVKKTREYQADYVKYAVQLNMDESDADLAKEILVEMETNYNLKRSDDPIADAERNYHAAESSVLRKKIKGGNKVVTPLDKNKGKEIEVPTGVSGGDKVKASASLKIEMDSTAKEWAEKFGLSVDEINEALSSEGGFSGNKFESKREISR